MDAKPLRLRAHGCGQRRGYSGDKLCAIMGLPAANTADGADAKALRLRSHGGGNSSGNSGYELRVIPTKQRRTNAADGADAKAPGFRSHGSSDGCGYGCYELRAIRDRLLDWRRNGRCLLRSRRRLFIMAGCG